MMTSTNLFRLVLSLLFLSNTIHLSAKLAPYQQASRYQHLCEVNAQWLKQCSPSDFLASISYTSEDSRIQDHLMLVAELLKSRDASKLSALQQRNRSAGIEALIAYAQTGKFPINSYHQERTPYFVDGINTHCAVGHLIRETGELDLIQRIRTSTNYGYVLEELRAFPEIEEWATVHGFTVEELAWIQPAYTNLVVKPSAMGNNLGVDGGKVLAAAATHQAGVFYAGGDFISFDGIAAQGLVRISNGLVAEVATPLSKIEQLWFDEQAELLFAFGIPDQQPSQGKVLLAMDRDENFYPVHDGYGNEDFLLVARDSFASAPVFVESRRSGSVDSISLFRFEIGSSPQRVRLANNYSLSGRLNDLILINNTLMLGGEILLTDLAGDTISWNNLDYDISTDTFGPNTNRIISCQSLFDCDTLIGSPVISRYLSSWNLDYYFGDILIEGDTSTSIQATEVRRGYFSPGYEVIKLDNPTSKFIKLDDPYSYARLFSGAYTVINDISPDELFDSHFIYRVSASLIQTPFSANQLILANAAQRDSMLVVGEFTQLGGVPINHVAWLKRDFVSGLDEIPALEARVWLANNTIHIELEDANPEAAKLYLYSTTGQLMQVETLDSGQQTFSIPIHQDTPILCYAIQSSLGVKAGKLGDLKGF